MNENLFFTLILKVIVSVVGRLFSLESIIVFINDDITDVGLIKKIGSFRHFYLSFSFSVIHLGSLLVILKTFS